MSSRTLADLVDGFADRGDRLAIVLHESAGQAVRWSFAELAGETVRAASGLRRAGVTEGEVVGLLAPNGPAWLAAFFGIVRAGAVAMPLAEQITDHELGRIIEHSGCRRLITTAGHAGSADALRERPELELILLGPASNADDLDRPFRPWQELIGGEAADPPALEPDHNAALLYTSGTTGTPKGVPLTHANLCANVDALLEADLATPADRILLPLPFYHAYPLTVGLLAPLAIGAAVVTPAGITGPQIAAALGEYGCTIMIAVPRLYEAMVGGIERRLRPSLRPLYRGALAASIWVRRRFGVRVGRVLFRPLHRRLGPHLRLVASGGSRLDPEVAWRLEGLGFEVLTGYGLTETAPLLTFNPPGQARLDSAGRPVEGVELRVEPTEDAGEGQGEILARGPNLFGGYWRNPEATRESFTDDGFFRTGDLGFLGDDGYLRIVGRAKELIVLAGGKNVFPDEIEAVLEQSELIHEIGVLEHDGRLVGLVLPEADAVKGLSGDDLHQRVRGEIERLSQKLPSYQRLGDFAITRQLLPRTQIGKIRRHELPTVFEREKSGAGPRDTTHELSAQDKALLRQPAADRVWAWLQERFEEHPLDLDTSPQLDLGLDSFDWMSLVVELQERFGARLDEDAVARVATLRDLLREVVEASRRPPPEDEKELSPDQERWLQPQGQGVLVFGRILFALNRAVFRTLFRLRVEGAEHLPPGTACLISPNHLSYLDPFALAAALSFDQLRHTYWAGWTGLLFRGPLTRLFSRATRVLPVDPERGLTSTLVIGRAALERGHALVWFPEGQRSRDGELKPFLPGVGWLLERSDVPAVPVAIEGTFQAWPADRVWPRPRPLKVTIGAPVPAGDLLAARDDAERHAKAADRLRDAVVALGAPTAHGSPKRAA